LLKKKKKRKVVEALPLRSDVLTHQGKKEWEQLKTKEGWVVEGSKKEE
jgi:hypothetical protein